MARADVLVERALRDYPKTRSNDRFLILCVWYLQKPDYHDSQKGFITFFTHQAIMPETITRCRRKLQEQGKYPGTHKATEARYNKFKQMNGSANLANASQITDMLGN